MPDSAIDVGPRIEGVAHTERGRRRRHELHEALGTAVGDGVRIELGFDLDDGGDEVLGHGVSTGRRFDVRLDGGGVGCGPHVRRDVAGNDGQNKNPNPEKALVHVRGIGLANPVPNSECRNFSDFHDNAQEPGGEFLIAPPVLVVRLTILGARAQSRPRHALAGVTRAEVVETDTIVSRFFGLAAAQPDALAYVEKGQHITYEGLARRVRATAVWLDGAGVKAGDVVALSFDSPFTESLRSLQFFYALAGLGAVVLPLYPDVPMSERLALLTRFGARWLIPRNRSEASAHCARLDPHACDWRAIERDGGVAPRGDDPRQPLLLQFSGGTTGAPKVVVFTHEQYLTNMLVGATEIGATAADRVVSSRPWPTVPAVRNLVRILSIGGVFINAAFPETSEDLGRLVDESGATVLIASPWQLRRVLAAAQPTPRRRSEPRLLYVAGAFIAPHELQAAREAITQNIYVCYGCTEVGFISFLRPDDPMESVGTVGRLVPGLDAQVADADYRPLPAGAVGNLGFRAPWIPDRYVGNEAATAEHFRDGWFYPGDVGAVDAGGWIRLQGRADDVINFGGVKLQPEDVEAVIAQHPDVEDAAVVGAPHAMAGTVPVALVVLRRPVTPQAVMAFCQSRIDASRLPVAVLPVPEILRSADGKILRQRLLETYKITTRP